MAAVWKAIHIEQGAVSDAKQNPEPAKLFDTFPHQIGCIAHRSVQDCPYRAK